MRPRILFDVDGVLTTGFVDEFCRIASAYHKRSIAPVDIDEWDIKKALSLSKDAEDHIYDRIGQPGICFSFMPAPGMRELVQWAQGWADVYACTSPVDSSPHWEYERRRWCEEVIGIPRKRVISTGDKAPIEGNVLIEDKLSNLEAWAGAHPSAIPILYRTLHNRKDKWSGVEAFDCVSLHSLLAALARREGVRP